VKRAVENKILVINGPNLNLLGFREPGLYGITNLEQINNELKSMAVENQIDLECFQSNWEGAIIDKIHSAYGQVKFIIINAGALTHYSIAIHDALKAVEIPVIEVHLTNIYAREGFRQKSYISPVAVGGIFGMGPDGYKMALQAAINMIKNRNND
jgi:3-dehydroquinate dehydratase-2